MKKEVPDNKITQKIISLTKDMGGIFSTSDLYHLIGATSPLNNQRAIDRIVENDLLNRAKKGIYVFQNFDAPLLSSRLIPQSYISMDTVLIRNGLVGTLNPSRVSCVTSRARSKTYAVGSFDIAYHSVARKLFFGFETKEHGVRWADNEKSYLDLLYFHLHGAKFPFDPKNEVRTDKLDLKRVRHYLKKYGNPKFKTFVEGLIHD